MSTPEPAIPQAVKAEDVDISVTQVEAAPASHPLKRSKNSSSQTPVPQPVAVQSPPSLPEGLSSEDVIGGSPLRRYLNRHLTAELVTGIKKCGLERPERPLKWLGEWLIARDAELASTKTGKDVQMDQ